MYNYFMLIGIIQYDFEVTELEDGKRVTTIWLSIMREFKNSYGTYDYDNVCIQLWGFLADIAKENLKKGTKVGIKGRIRPKKVTLEGGKSLVVNDLIGDNIVFFGNSNPKELKEEENKEAKEEE